MAQRGAQAYALPLAAIAGAAWYEASPLLRMAREAARAEAEAAKEYDDADEAKESEDKSEAKESEDEIDDEDDDESPELMRLAQDLPQLNLAVGLRNVAYDQPQYVELLHACRAAFAQRADALEAAHRARDAERMRLEAHSLAGSLGSIGAETLRLHAAELELAIYDGLATQVRIQAPAFLSELRSFLRQLHCCFGAQVAQAPSRSGYPSMWYDTALALRERVAEYDYTGALSLLASLEWAHAPEDGPWLAQVRRALENFDYQALGRLLQTLPKEA